MAAIFNHPDIPSGVLTFVPAKELTVYRAINKNSHRVADGFITSEIVEYMLKGPLHVASPQVIEIGKLFRSLKFFETNEEFEKVVVPFLRDDCTGSAEIRGNALIRLGFLMHPRMIFPDIELSVNGTVYNQKQCWEKGLTLSPNNAIAWTTAGANLMKNDDTLKVGDTDYNRVDCFKKGVSLAPNNFTCWFRLTTAMSSDDEYKQGDRTYKRLDAAEKAVDLDPKVGPAWAWLGFLLDAGAEATVGGRKYGKKQCYIQSAEVDPTFNDWIYFLAREINEGDEISVLGKNWVRRGEELVAK